MRGGHCSGVSYAVSQGLGKCSPFHWGGGGLEGARAGVGWEHPEGAVGRKGFPQGQPVPGGTVCWLGLRGPSSAVWESS